VSIDFQEFDVQQFRAEIAKMSDAELMSLGRSLRSLCYPRAIAPRKSAFDIHLQSGQGETSSCPAPRTRDHGDAPEPADLFLFFSFFLLAAQTANNIVRSSKGRDRAGLLWTDRILAKSSRRG
jgi:hypothetical protein